MWQKHGERGLEWQDSEKCGRVWKKHDEMFRKSMVKEERNGSVQKDTAGFEKSMMKHIGFGGKWQLENGSIGPEHGEIPLNFGISSYFWSFYHAFFRFILNLSALFLQRNRLVLFFSDLF